MASTLLVRLVSAQLTHDTETFGNMDPYCKVYLGSQMKSTKVLNSAGKSPVWNQILAFSRMNEDLLRIEVWDQDTLKSDDLVGEVEYPLSRIQMGEKVAEELTLTYTGKSAGTIRVDLTIGPPGPPGTANQPPGFFVGPPAPFTAEPAPPGAIPQFGEFIIAFQGYPSAYPA